MGIGNFLQSEDKKAHQKLDAIVKALTFLVEKEKKHMGILEEVQADVIALKGKVDALNTALDGYRDVVAALKQQLADLQAGTTLPPAVQQKVEAIKASVADAAAAVENTYKENFPDAPPEEPTV